MSQVKEEPPLSKEDQEDEEMRDALKAVGLYETDMTRNDMKLMVNMLKESEDSAKSNKSNAHGDNSKTSPQQEIKPLPSFSLKTESACDKVQRSGSLPSKKPVRDQEAGSQLDSDVHEKSPNHQLSLSPKVISKDPFKFDDDDFPGLGKSKSDISEMRTQSRNAKKSAAAALKKATSERWALDIFQCKKDVTPSLLENGEGKLRNPPPLVENTDTESEFFKAAVTELTAKLRKLHYEYYFKCPKNGDSRGPPVQISESEEDQNLTENPSTSSVADEPVRNTRDRATKRKAISTIAAASYDNSNDENSDDEFVNDTRKRKCPQEKKGDPIRKRNQGIRNIKVNESHTEPLDKSDFELEIVDQEFDNSTLKPLRKTNKVPACKEIPEEKSEFPRRVVPPNPNKKNGKGLISKQKISESQKMKAKCGLNDEEILKTIHQLDEQINDDDDCVEITNEVKPLPVKSLTEKLRLGSSKLRSAQNAEQQMKKALEKKKADKEKQELLNKKAIVDQRLQVENDEKLRKMEKQEKFEKQGEVYNAILNNNAAKRKALGLRPPALKETQKGSALEVGGDDPIMTHAGLANEELCPICQESFHVDLIESHASECIQFLPDTIKSSFQASSPSIYDCHLCDYKTTNGNDYGEHVTACTEAAQDRRSEHGINR